MGKEAFKMLVDAPATPERVAAAASFIDRILKAAHPGLEDGAITVVVTNLNMGTAVRSWTPDGRLATDRVLSFLDNPTKALDRDPTSRAIAAALSHPVGEIDHARIVRPRGRKPIATLDEQFSRRMAALAASTTPASELHGTTVVYSLIYRVGRWDDDKAIKIRIRIDGECHDVALLEGASAKDFHEAAAAERIFPVYLNAVWFRAGDGLLHYDHKRTRAVSVDLKWNPLSGDDFVAAMNEAAPLGYQDDEDLAERIELMRRASA